MTVKSQTSSSNCRCHYSDVMFGCCLFFWLVGWLVFGLLLFFILFCFVEVRFYYSVSKAGIELIILP